MDLKEVALLITRIKMSCLGVEMGLLVSKDMKGGDRIYLQVWYKAPCVKTGEIQAFKGRKWYLSEHMTPDEVIKTSYAAFKATVEHEVMEGFTVDDIILFNPHVNFESLLSISNNEVTRK